MCLEVSSLDSKIKLPINLGVKSTLSKAIPQISQTFKHGSFLAYYIGTYLGKYTELYFKTFCSLLGFLFVLLNCIDLLLVQSN